MSAVKEHPAAVHGRVAESAKYPLPTDFWVKGQSIPEVALVKKSGRDAKGKFSVSGSAVEKVVRDAGMVPKIAIDCPPPAS